MDIHEALYTTRMMRRLRPDPVPLDTQARILDAAIRAPNGANTQRWHELLGVPVAEDWTMSAMLALGYPRGTWGVAANRHPVHEVSSRNGWDKPFGVEVPQPLWPPHDEMTAGLAGAG